MVLFTDGITESGAPEGEEYGAERALEYIQAHRHETAREIADGLCRAAQEFAPAAPPLDDMTVLVCKVAPKP